MPLAAEMLVPRVDENVARELRAIPDVDDVLAKLVTRGATAHPELILQDAPVAWASYLQRHLTESAVASYLAKLRAEDVHVVLACAESHALAYRAHTHLDERLRAVARQALIGIELRGLSIDDLLQDVREKLLLDGKLKSYGGHGSLDGWLRVTLTRVALSALRQRPSNGHVHDGDEALSSRLAQENPQLDALRSRCAPALERAIEEALTSLSDESRTLLRLHFVDGLTIDDLALVYHLHRATLARRLAKERNAVFELARTRAVHSLGLAEVEFQSLVNLLLSQIDFTLRRVLDTKNDDLH